MVSRSITATTLTVALLAGASGAQARQRPDSRDAAEKPRDVTHLSLEELMNVKVSLSARHSQNLMEASAAVYVVTGDELVRRGVTSLPEALRLVPGLMVAAIDANDWAISARGFIDATANKLQVLVDGRSLYTQLFSGVFWDMQNLPIETIDRVEIVRGPGAALWGANAVNGVISITTKRPQASDRSFIKVQSGSNLDSSVTAIYEGRTGNDTPYRIFAGYVDGASTELRDGADAFDGWARGEVGFRMDTELSDTTTWMLQGQAYSSTADTESLITLSTSPFQALERSAEEMSGSHLLSRWVRQSATGGEATLRAYLEATRQEIPNFFREERITTDVEFQYHRPRARKDLLWGFRLRSSRDRIANSFTIGWTPESAMFGFYGLFGQVEWRPRSEQLNLTAGGQLEYNDFSGWELQPNLRMSWRLAPRAVLWASAARALRTPSRLDRDLRLRAFVAAGQPPLAAVTIPNKAFRAEELVAFEAGFRTLLSSRLSLDLALFHNEYDDLRSFEGPFSPEFNQASGFLELPFLLANSLAGRSRGVEMLVRRESGELSWQVGGSLFDLSLESRSAVSADDIPSLERSDPKRQLFATLDAEPGPGVQLHVALRYVSALESRDVSSYTEADFRVRWKLARGFGLSLIGKNVLDSAHVEFDSIGSQGQPQARAIPRALGIALDWQSR